MTSRTVEEERELAKAIRPILRKSSPNLNLQAAAEAAQRSGLVTGREAERIALQGEFPSWLARHVGPKKRRLATAPDDAVTVTELLPGTTVERPRPHALHHHDTLPKPFHRTAVPVPSIRAVSGGPANFYVANFRRVVWTDDGVIAPLSTEAGKVLQWFFAEATPLHLSGRAFMGVVEGAAVFTHWMNDVLPRLLFLEDSGVDLQSFDCFVFTTISQPFHRETLQILGINPSKVLTRQNDGVFFKADHFTEVTAPRRGFVAHPRVYDRLVERFGLSAEPKRRGRRLLLSRSGAARRRILNEPELATMLARHGFELISFEAMSVREGAAAMAEASHVIAPHGAGLANVMFMPPGGTVVEVFSAHASSEYYATSVQRGHTYALYEALGPHGSAMTNAEREAINFFECNGMDIIVPLDDFELFLTNNNLI